MLTRRLDFGRRPSRSHHAAGRTSRRRGTVATGGGIRRPEAGCVRLTCSGLSADSHRYSSSSEARRRYWSGTPARTPAVSGSNWAGTPKRRTASSSTSPELRPSSPGLSSACCTFERAHPVAVPTTSAGLSFGSVLALGLVLLAIAAFALALNAHEEGPHTSGDRSGSRGERTVKTTFTPRRDRGFYLRREPAGMLTGVNVVLGVSGSIAAVRRLSSHTNSVDWLHPLAVMTDSATGIIHPSSQSSRRTTRSLPNHRQCRARRPLRALGLGGRALARTGDGKHRRQGCRGNR